MTGRRLLGAARDVLAVALLLAVLLVVAAGQALAQESGEEAPGDGEEPVEVVIDEAAPDEEVASDDEVATDPTGDDPTDDGTTADVGADGDGTDGDGTDGDGSDDVTPPEPAPGVAVSVEDGVVLDLTLTDSVEVAVVVTLTNPTDQVVTDVAVTVTGADLVSDVPSRLEPGEVITLDATAVVTGGEAPAGLVTVTAVMTGVVGDGDGVVAQAMDIAPLIEISATVIEREDPADASDDAPDEAPMVLDEVLEATGPEPVESAADPAELPATGVPTMLVALLALSALWAGNGVLAAGRPHD